MSIQPSVQGSVPVHHRRQPNQNPPSPSGKSLTVHGPTTGSQVECTRDVDLTCRQTLCPYLPLQATMKHLDQVSRENQLIDLSRKPLLTGSFPLSDDLHPVCLCLLMSQSCVENFDFPADTMYSDLCLRRH